MPDLEAAYRRCEVIARRHYENFPVVSLFLPRRMRRSLAAVYAFARGADDLADEGYGPGGPAQRERLAALDDWESRLRSALGLGHEAPEGPPARSLAAAARDHGVPTQAASRDPDGLARSESRGEGVGLDLIRSDDLEGRAQEGRDADEVFLALANTVRGHDLEPSLFLDLLSAFRQDVVVDRYATRDQLLDYCRRSANPVGRIVLGIHGSRDEVSAIRSDSICTGLQLANFWQDVAVDREKGRVYLPREDRERSGVDERDLGAATASAALRALVLEECAWTRSFFEAGRPLVDSPPQGIGLHLRLVWHGGMRILEMVEAAGGDVLAKRPSLRNRDRARMLLRALLHGRAS